MQKKLIGPMTVDEIIFIFQHYLFADRDALQQAIEEAVPFLEQLKAFKEK